MAKPNLSPGTVLPPRQIFTGPMLGRHQAQGDYAGLCCCWYTDAAAPGLPGGLQVSQYRAAAQLLADQGLTGRLLDAANWLLDPDGGGERMHGLQVPAPREMRNEIGMQPAAWWLHQIL